jgi:hypothetical protein
MYRHTHTGHVSNSFRFNPYTSVGRLKGRLSALIQCVQAHVLQYRVPKAEAAEGEQ